MRRLIVGLAACFCVVACAGNTSSIAARIKAREAAKQQGEFTHYARSSTGRVKFDHTKNDGHFTIISGAKKFATSWGGCITGKIWAYREQDGLIGYKQGYKKFPSTAEEFENVLDFSNRVVAVEVGDVALFDKVD